MVGLRIDKNKSGGSKETCVSRWKRPFDVLLIVLSLPVITPLFVAIAALIKFVSKGPVFYRQTRIGHEEQPFTCLKFRTMRRDVKTCVHETYFKELMGSQKPMIKLDAYGDERLIRFGGFLRASGLDELPQLLNVLAGQMSIVGPRPCTLTEFQNYLPWQKARFNAIPGLTGLWQVSGKNKTTFDEMIRFDIEYSRRRSVGTDILIMFRTLPVLLRQICELIANKFRRSHSDGRNRSVNRAPRHANNGSRGWQTAKLAFRRVAETEK